MFKYDINLDDEFLESLARKLDLKGTDPAVLGEVTRYLHTNACIMDRLIEGFQVWTGAENKSMADSVAFLGGIIKLMDLFRKNVEQRDGIVGTYLAGLDLPEMPGEGVSQPWQFDEQPDLSGELGGVFRTLAKMGVKQETIDEMYLDGNLLEIYDECRNTVNALKNLNETAYPGPIDLREGLFVIEERLHKLYGRLFIDDFGGRRGVYGCLEAIIKQTLTR